MLKVEMQGGAQRRFKRMSERFEEAINTNMNICEEKVMAFVKKSAKLRSPRWTGQLADSINYTKNEDTGKRIKWSITVESPYGWFQEVGWKPKFLGADTPNRVGQYVGNWMEDHGISGFGIKPRGEPHPFFQPAVEAGLNRADQFLEEAGDKALKDTTK